LLFLLILSSTTYQYARSPVICLPLKLLTLLFMNLIPTLLFFWPPRHSLDESRLTRYQLPHSEDYSYYFISFHPDR
jgi:hypothetical protein